MISSMDDGGISSNKCSSSLFKFNAVAIFMRERKEISPLLSNRFMEPKLTSDNSLSFCWDIFRFLRMMRMRSATSFCISPGVFDKKENVVFIAIILSYF